MGFSLNAGRVIAEPCLVSIHGHRGLGVLLLQFSVAWAINPSGNSSSRIHSTQGLAYARVIGKNTSAGRMVLGEVLPETAWIAETLQHEREITLIYRLFLSSTQLLAIEHLRQGNSLELSLDLHGLTDGTVDGMPSTFPGNATIQKTINPHDWADILRSLGARDTLFVGVDLPLDSTVYSGLLRTAHEHLIAGRYEAAVGECRKAIDALFQREGLDEYAKKLNGIVITEKHSQRDRRLSLVNAIKRFTQRALHPDGGEMASYSREDAALTIASTISALASIIVDEESRREH